MEGRLLSEDHYLEEMRGIVEPELAACRTSFPVCREEGRPLFCVRYTPENPRAVILVSHGFTETAEKYRELTWYLVRNGYAVCLLEHCGHGRSYLLTQDRSRVHVDRYERWQDDLLFTAHALKEAMPGLPLLLFAHSMGGGIGACALSAEPGLFAGAVLSSPMIRPASGGVPWPAVKLLCSLFCAVGKSQDYAPGQGPYRPGERFEDSAALSRPRHAYYQELRDADANGYCRMGGATYGWMNAAVKMNTWLQTEGWKTVDCPLLLFQAEDDAFVINSEQDRFMEKVGQHNADARLIPVPHTKHEIYNSHNDVLEGYLEEILQFYQRVTCS